MAKAVTAYEQPKPIGAAKDDISNFAETIANFLNYSPGADLKPIVEYLGGKLSYSSKKIKGSKAASITVEKSGAFTITLFRYLFPLQERMSIAHELGHLFLHSQLGKVPLRASRSIGKEDEEAESAAERAESEAHHFACAFLMPSGAVKETVEQFGRDSLAVAAAFMVPEPIAYQRMVDVCG